MAEETKTLADLKDLVTPPADHFHTLAAAMPTDLEVAFE